MKQENEVQKGPPATFTLSGILKQGLRYGENPHQEDAALYMLPYGEPCVAHGNLVPGGERKEVGFNNVQDMNTAFEVVKEFGRPAACIVKHSGPCGVATEDDLLTACRLAYEGDPVSAFGGALGLNRTLDSGVAQEFIGIKGFKFDAIVVPEITHGALEILAVKKWGREVVIVVTGWLDGKENVLRPEKRVMWQDARAIPGGLLAQPCDRLTEDEEFANLKTVSKREPTPKELAALKFAWIVCKHVKSNAIVLGRETTIVGVGAGQPSRVDSVNIALKKAGERAKGAVLASDAFFPFPDGPEEAAKAGVTAMIQTGGSVKDGEVIAVCDKYNVALVTTGIRHFRH